MLSDTRATATYDLRRARPGDLDGARSVILDTLYRDLGYGYSPAWHADVIDLDGHYLRDPRQALFVAVHDGEVVATTAVRAAAPKSPPHPEWLVSRYHPDRTAQLFRVYVRPGHRRHGLARRLVALATDFVAAAPDYDVLYLHTDARSPGADDFWRSVAVEVHDARDGDPAHFQTVHFEVPLPGGRR
ncbi:GNAT family N-acetyltransferase [Actinokineospora bangkokensis]|uniref:GNAT family N-acetyltransferase n=1 Tax=Actinokineospora bangkokensis TaxID=1193682 RepID=A0A1Q9LRH8_9PSEU|nr:GNAT family N-acetyltransferase [Actinokineospora bangkokensis]OLR94618.1 GNAT family N-acetyltransferase [Actinokineospora bangkokensis]